MTTLNDDDQDIYISERSSIASSNDFHQPSPRSVKRLPTPSPSPPMLVSQKQTPGFRYRYNVSPEHGALATTQFWFERQDDKKQPKKLLKVPSGPKGELKPSEAINKYSCQSPYYKAKHMEKIVRHRHQTDTLTKPYESANTLSYAPLLSLTTSPIKPSPPPRKSRRHGVEPLVQLQHDKQVYDRGEKNAPASHWIPVNGHENDHQGNRSTPRKNLLLLKDAPTTEQRDDSKTRKLSQQRHKLQVDHEFVDYSFQSFSNQVVHEPNSRSKNRSTVQHTNATKSNAQPATRHRQQVRNPPSIPSHQPQHHIRRRSPSGSVVASDFQFVDASLKKAERLTQFQQTRDRFHLSSPTSPPPPPVSSPPPPPHTFYQSSSHLPPIVREPHPKIHPNRFPSEYYGTLARQTGARDRNEPLGVASLHKAESQARFYDRYVTHTPDKRLVA